MNFLNNLYFVEAESLTTDSATYGVCMNPQHEIYAAHFPGNPITPGVCILQMGLELLCKMSLSRLELVQVKNVKFLNILRPDGSKVFVRIHNVVEEEKDELRAQVDFSTKDQVVAKMSLICRKTAK